MIWKRATLILTFLCLSLYFSTIAPLYAYTPQEVAVIAARTALLILTPGNSGSGALIGRSDSIYYVLTARHVVENVAKDEETIIRLPDGQEYLVKSIEKLDNADLAVLTFSSSKDYPVAVVREEALSSLETIYVSGWPLTGEELTEITLQTTKGEVTKILDNNRDAYNLVYTNVTKEGMSGGPILDQNGLLVGIHGRADTSRFSKSGFNLGIPIQVFLNNLTTLAVHSSLIQKNGSQSVIGASTVDQGKTLRDKAMDLNSQGNVLMDKGQLVEAIALLNKAIAMDPTYETPRYNSAVAYFNLGVASYNQEQWAEVITNMELALTRSSEPTIITAVRKPLAKAYRQQAAIVKIAGKEAEATELLQKAERLLQSTK